jgi:hypothetical protein
VPRTGAAKAVFITPSAATASQGTNTSINGKLRILGGPSAVGK